MYAEHGQIDWSFYVAWVLIGTISLVLAGFLAFATIWSVGAVAEQALGETAAALVVSSLFGALLGAGIGIGQGLVLQTCGVNAIRWVAISVVAATIGLAIVFTPIFVLLDMEAIPQPVAGALLGLSLGLSLGVGQWFVLRAHMARASLWVPAIALALMVGFVVGLPLGGEGREWLSLGVISLLSAAISGLGMVWLRRQPTVAL